MSRHLWFGAALVSAFGSIYAGLFGVSLLQYVLIAAAVVSVVMALRSPAAPPSGDDPGRRH